MSPRYKLSSHLGASVNRKQPLLYPVHVVVNLIATAVTLAAMLVIMAAVALWSVWTIFRGEPSVLIKFWRY
jgi:hypothetical protein